MDLIYVFGIWVLRKLLAFSLKLCLPSFFPIVSLQRRTEKEETKRKNSGKKIQEIDQWEREGNLT